MNQKLDKNFQDIICDGDTLGLPGAVKAEVHEEGGGVLEAVHPDLPPGEELGHQPGHQAALQQCSPDPKPVGISGNKSLDNQ